MNEQQVESMIAFISDFIGEISDRKAEADEELKKDYSDLFCSGRAMAYNEVYEILQSRLDIHGIEIQNGMIEE